MCNIRKIASNNRNCGLNCCRYLQFGGQCDFTRKIITRSSESERNHWPECVHQTCGISTSLKTLFKTTRSCIHSLKEIRRRLVLLQPQEHSLVHLLLPSLHKEWARKLQILVSFCANDNFCGCGYHHHLKSLHIPPRDLFIISLLWFITIKLELLLKINCCVLLVLKSCLMKTLKNALFKIE